MGEALVDVGGLRECALVQDVSGEGHGEVIIRRGTGEQ